MKDHETRTHYREEKIRKLSESPALYSFSLDTEKLLVRTIVDILMEAGFSPRLKGFNFIVDSIRIMYRKRFGHILITKDIYYKLGAMYEVSPYIIEHNIRNSIHAAWTKHIMTDESSDFFEPFTDKPKNSELIVYVSRLATDRISNPQLSLWEIDPTI